VTVEGKPSHIAFIDGKRIGALPVRRYPIGPGRHDIVIQVPRGKPKHFPVWVRTGKEVPVRVE
jgi:hypothetical protein